MIMYRPEDDNVADEPLIPLFTSGPEVTPPYTLWAALDARLEHEPKIDRLSDGFWATTAPGVQTKLLWDGRSLLIQCDAGAVIPEHEHFAEERIIVVMGDMIIEDVTYHVGDTLMMAKGTQHGQTTTKTGCAILISYVG